MLRRTAKPAAEGGRERRAKAVSVEGGSLGRLREGTPVIRSGATRRTSRREDMIRHQEFFQNERNKK